MERIDLTRTRRQIADVMKRVTRKKNPVPFREAWVDHFVREKFGAATTHWSKLQDRVQRGVGNPCSWLAACAVPWHDEAEIGAVRLHHCLWIAPYCRSAVAQNRFGCRVTLMYLIGRSLEVIAGSWSVRGTHGHVATSWGRILRHLLADICRLWQRGAGGDISGARHRISRGRPGVRIDGADHGLCGRPHLRRPFQLRR